MFKIVFGQIIDPDFRAQYAESMFRLRHDVFHDQLGWDVNSFDGMEYDEYDDRDAVYVLVVSESSDEVLGCFRLRPTNTPYMLKDLFPELVGDAAAPEQKDVWEISRYAVKDPRFIAYPDDVVLTRAAFGFNEISTLLFGATQWFARQNNISNYVMATIAPMFRSLRHYGFSVERFAKPVRIGDVLSIGLDLNPHSLPSQFTDATNSAAKVELRQVA